MKTALSILIPTFNYNVYPLVKQLHAQAEALAISFEIKVYDDCSPNPIIENKEINSLRHASYTILPKNIGRSAIRNLLAEEAAFDTLLFLDADTKVVRDDFIESYLKSIQADTQIIYGGILYQKETPSPSEILRWKYGNAREAIPVSERKKSPHLRFLTLNFLILKKVFQKLKFNETIPNLRHEDTLFALDCKKHNIQVQHIDNPVIHLGLENSAVFLKKSRESVAALQSFIQQGLIDSNETALSKKAASLKKRSFSKAVQWSYEKFKPQMEKNLLSANPSLFIFDIYRLGYYLQLDS